MKKPLEDIIYETLENCGRSKSAVALDMGKPLSTLSRETSPYDAGAKLGAADLVPFMKATGSTAPLEMMAFAMGLKVILLCALPDGRDMREEIIQAYEAIGAFLNAANSPDTEFSKLSRLFHFAVKEMEDVISRWGMEVQP